MIQNLQTRHQVMLVCDMHGHTKKKNIFMYGCSINSPEVEDKEKNLLARVIPHHLSKKNPFFSFVDSHFRIEKNKDSTARIVLFTELGIVHSYTMEASFFGPSSSEAFKEKFHGDMHMSTDNLATVGEDLCRCCFFFNSQKVYNRKIRQTNNFLRKEMMKLVETQESPLDKDDEKELEIETFLDEEIGIIVKEQTCENLVVVDIGVDPESSGSDSDPSDSESKDPIIPKKLNKVLINPVKPEKIPNRTTTSVIKTVSIKKPQVSETD